MLTPLQGVNPLATITALAERSVDLIAKKGGLTVATSKNGRLDLFGQPARFFGFTPDMVAASKSSEGGVRFTEVMTGHIYIGDGIDDFDTAENLAKGAASFARLYISVDAPNDRTINACDRGIQRCRRLPRIGDRKCDT